MMLPKKVLVFPVETLLLSLLLANLGNATAAPINKVNLKEQAGRLLAQQLGVDAKILSQVGKTGQAKYPLQGIDILEYKFVDTQGNPYSIAITPAGKKVDASELDAKEAEHRNARYGNLDKELADFIAAASPDDMVEVDMWIQLPDSEQESPNSNLKPEVDGGKEQQEFASRAEAKRMAANESSSAEDFNAVKAMEAKAIESIKAEASKREAIRVEEKTVPFAESLRAEGYEAVATSVAPVVSAKLPVRKIREYALNNEIVSISRGGQLGQEMDVARQAVGANTVNSLGITGTGGKVAVVEFGGIVNPLNSYLSGIDGITIDNPYACPFGDHVTGIAGIIRSTHATYNGIASGSSLWAGCGQNDAQIQTMTNRANSWGADTFSLSFYTSLSQTPTVMDKFFDNFMFSHYDLVVKSAGNQGGGSGWVTPPGIGYNTLAVGSYDDRNTIAETDDIVASYSSYVDPLSTYGDREKPEVVAPGTNIMSSTMASPWIGSIGSGTSYAAPVVAGISALMYQRNPSLKSWPEATKAIIMATAIKNKEGATRLSEKDGAGGAWAPGAEMVARNSTSYGRWGGRSYTCAEASSVNLSSMYLYSGYKTRVVIVWDQNPDYAYYSSKPSADLDLKVKNPSGSLVASSSSWDNTYEIVEFTPTVTGYYTIDVAKHRCDLTPRYIGWAWYQR